MTPPEESSLAGIGRDYVALRLKKGPLAPPKRKGMRKMRHDPLFLEFLLRRARESIVTTVPNYIPARGYSKYHK